MEVTALKLPVHEHLLYPSTRFLFTCCEGCRVEGQIYGGYRCNESDCYNKLKNGVWFHKECVESPSEIIHPSHPEHPLTFTGSGGYKACHLCGLAGSGYCCAICDFVINMACVQKPPPPPTIEHPMFHEHSLVLRKNGLLINGCKVCHQYTYEGYSYECLSCEDAICHLNCVNQPREVNHSSHSSHILEFFTSESLSENAEKTCILCGEEPQHVLYHCSKCNFTICIYCERNPPPLSVEHTKTHRHKLSLLSRRVSFTCNVCGLQGHRSPYACIQCSFLVHRDCIDLPRLININRHDHRISLTDYIGRENLKCGVCHQIVDQYCGGYTCSTCPDFVVHSSCPIKHNVWDGIELEGIPEEEVIPPFEVVGDNLIKHFSHENHILRLESDGTSTRDEKTRCEACVSPVYSDPIYSCEQCDFFLHQTCANLPMKKRLPFHNIQFKLCAPDMDSYEAFKCYACRTMFSGFRYEVGGFKIDVRCGTFSELESYDFHDHPLYYGDKNVSPRCRACQRGEVLQKMLACDDCDFEFDFRCFNLPRVVKHKDDEPPLSLCYGEEDPKGKYWCDICEGETNPKDWFYTCSHFGVTLHVQCVLGDFSFLMPRRIIQYFGKYYKFEVVPNNHCFRPFCACCQSRCIGPFFLKISNPEIIYICSEDCLNKKIIYRVA